MVHTGSVPTDMPSLDGTGAARVPYRPAESWRPVPSAHSPVRPQPPPASPPPVRPAAWVRHALLELQRRKVPNTAATYAALTLGSLEVLDRYEGILGIPEQIVSFLAVFAVFGLPVAIMLSWTFRITMEDPAAGRPGVDTAARPGASTETDPPRLWPVLAAGLLMALAAAWMVWRQMIVAG